MKARTKAQIEVFNLSKIVLDVADKIKNWAIKECNEHIGITTKKHFWCIDCRNEHSKIQYVARSCNMGNYEPRYGDFEIRKPTYYKVGNYNPLPYIFFQESYFKDNYSKYGINHELQGLTFLTASRILPYDNRAETLSKSKQISLFSACGQNGHVVAKHWNSIKIAKRNKYIIEDAGIWFDYLDLLEYFGKDLRSPKYCFQKI